MATAIKGFVPTVMPNERKSKGFNDMSGSDFIKLMITQLQQQDPLDPSKSDQLLTQMSQIKQLESSDNLNKSLEKTSLQQSISSAGNLIGKTVDGLTGDGDETTGIVTSVKVEEGKVLLELDNGDTLPLENITEIAQKNPAVAANSVNPLSNLAGGDSASLLAALQNLGGAQ